MVLLGWWLGPWEKRMEVPLLLIDDVRPAAILPLREKPRDIERALFFLTGFEREVDVGSSESELARQQREIASKRTRGQQRQRMAQATGLHLDSKPDQSQDKSLKNRTQGLQQRATRLEQAPQRCLQQARNRERTPQPQRRNFPRGGLGSPPGKSPASLGSLSLRLGEKLSPLSAQSRPGDLGDRGLSAPEVRLVQPRVRDIVDAAFLAALSFMMAVLVRIASPPSDSSSGYSG
mmetsp:Transcript_56337/g.134471  ORF Transcript_56337/g.134471 Transcript_56337/m.134471 type:complete len:234 (+) Transcript_56337:191-892(+)